ncbi:INO80 complex subunit B isoform X2 [Brassica rapa]|uniref:INO80 complex subunit B isoform X2 n=1 Tax=Brassica campestris TaxID=3711 RepID=UPI0004F162CE|nr:INO80 complex subunit B isoform X2 [Brassica rapa]
MEPVSEGSTSTLSGFMDRRRRSPLIRRPRDIKGSLHSFTFMPPSSDNSLKLKLKLGGGLTRTIQTNSEDNEICVQKTMYLREIHQSMTEKTKRGLKKRLLDQEQDSDDEEIRYLVKLKSKRITRDYQTNMEDGEHLSSDKHAVTERHKLKMGTVDSLVEGSTSGHVPTTRTRAPTGSSPLEFPDGLPCPSSKRQKQKLSEVEQQSKKAEAAQRRRMLSEKAAQEAEAEAIRKILGQDSGRKKKEEKIKKQQEERAQERATRASTLASNTVRLVIGPSGTTLTFSEDIGLPDIFKPITCSYPPPREKCVGPNCENSYKYRDSKSKLPLCSLSCYKAMQQPLIHC